MLLAAYRDTGYDVLLLLHIISVIIAMTGAVAHPLMFELEKRRADADIPALAQRILAPSRIYSISFALAGLIGFGLVSMSDEVIGWGDTWLWLSILLWVAANGVLHAMILPAERAVAGGDTTAISKIETAGRIATLLIVVVLYLMVFKPGGGL
jgi:uncharacterized membrane protein